MILCFDHVRVKKLNYDFFNKRFDISSTNELIFLQTNDIANNYFN